jgi:DNA-binding NtrC family response regulator
VRSYLIVDDNRAMAENIAEIVREAGDDAVATESGAEALRLVKERSFDALLTDVRMPSIDGVQLIREARRADPGLPAILFTAFTHDEALRQARQEGPVAVLPKPVPVPTLLDLLAKARRDGHVVLLEDDVGLGENLSEALRREGYGVRLLRSVAEIERLSGAPPFAALVDLRVPGAPDAAGMRLLAERYPSLPLLVVTGHDDIALPSPPHRVFLKPFPTESLLAVVDALHRAASGPRTP